MISYVLIIWLGNVDNFSDYDTFKTLKECEEKRIQVLKALKQADSKMSVMCKTRFIIENKK